ncbi:hypothetical protein AMJ83_06470 [candidate division WOR_3 bacterium SM23_42]|uniref:DUF8173 domain-containing protein n=1 Tax=candidate division WOR_3 bacterium SM23_42 TaxID=1703779 RepID=A0A0S8FTY6_UNCW3|nr:MAG: hypothetical protein AMJ83_06470 [candidate division WOR_3 bacterium SM23_42]
MKNLRWILGVLMIAGLVIPGHALVFKRDQSVEISADTVIEDDLIAFAGNVDIKGKVLGDVYAFAQSVTITGDVSGSIFAGGANITIDAQSAQTIWAFGGNVKVTGDISNNIMLAGGNLLVGENTGVGRDITAYGGQFTVGGDTRGTIRGSVGSFTMTGKSSLVKIKADKATVASSAQILGDFQLASENEPTIEQGATIGGEMIIKKPEQVEAGAFLAALAPALAFLITLIKIIVFIAKIIVGILLIAIFKRYVRRIMDTLLTKTWKSLGWGFLGIIVIPVSVVLLFVIVVGYPIGIIGVYIYTTLWYLSSIFIGLVIGEKVIKLFKKDGEISLYLSFIIGTLILLVVGFIPILNILVRIFTLLFGFGATLVGSWYLLKEMREKELV